MTQRLVRWALFLSEFNFKIVYRAGSANGKPDALSRRPDYASENDNLSSCDVPFTVLRPENFCAITSFVSSLNDQILNECKNDEFYSDIYNELSSDDSNNSRLKNFSISNSFLLFKNKIYVPPKCRSAVLNICHDSSSAGHYGIKKTSSLIYRDFWWPSLYPDVKNYIRSCDTCSCSKDFKHKPYGFLQPLEIPSKPWSSLSMDFITNLPLSNDFT